MTPIVNTHVHFPPNFSAFTTVADAIGQARAEQVAVLGASNFYDQQVYASIAELTQAAGITASYGLEFITHVPDLADQGVRVNDPANPGRMYLTGKGIDPARLGSPAARAVTDEIRRGNDQRSAQMVRLVADRFEQAGFATGLDAAAIAAAVAGRAEVPLAWVSLQERHIAWAFQQKLAELPVGERSVVLERAYGRPSTVGPDDAVALQAEIRSRLLKAGTPGFVPEVPLSFEQAYAQILAVGGIPCYPVLADGADPVCEFEQSPAELAEQLVRRGIHAAELIPGRNHGAVVDQYVRVLREAGLIVMAGTEHNTSDRIPLDPACADGPLSPDTRQCCYEATCVVVAHAERLRRGQAGYVDAGGAVSADLATLIAEGGQVIGGPPNRRPDLQE